MNKTLVTGSGGQVEGRIKYTLSRVYTSADGMDFHLQSTGEK